jgi:hypothetical protein
VVVQEVGKKGAVVVVDGGDLFWKARVLAPARKAQQLEKARLQTEAYSLVGLDAFVPGEGDFSLGLETFLEVVEAHDLPVLAVGLVCGDTRFEGGRVIERDGVRVGLIGFVGVKPAGCEGDVGVKEVQEAIRQQGPVDVRVVIAHGTAGQVAQIGRLSGVDFLLDGHARRIWVNPKPLEGGGFELGAGSRGKRLGVLSLEVRPGGSGWGPANERGPHHRFENGIVDLNAKIGEHAATQALVEAAKPRIAAALQPPRDVALDGPFVGSSACLGCHPAQFAQWRTTGHSRALGTLEQVGRSMDLDCYACHVTGAQHPQGPAHPAQVGRLRNVGCESCHGPGETHLAAPVAGTIQRKVARSTCEQCHDGQQDEGRFDWETYLPRVQH